MGCILNILMYILHAFFRCPVGPIRNKASQDRCLDGLMDKNVGEFIDHCRFKPYTGPQMALQVDQTSHFIHAPKEEHVSLQCEGNTPDQKIHGNHVVEVPYDCKLVSKNFEIPFTSKSNDYIPDLREIPMKENLKSIKEAMKEEHLQYITNNKQKLSKGFTIKDIHKAVKEDHTEKMKNYMENAQWIALGLVYSICSIYVLVVKCAWQNKTGKLEVS